MGDRIDVLIVEDELLIAQDLRILLENQGYPVVGIANNGIGALRLARKHFPTIIFMDINLKGKWDGIQTVEAIRNSNKTNIIYLTSCQDPVTLARAKKTKPFKILDKFKRQEIIGAITELSKTIL